MNNATSTGNSGWSRLQQRILASRFLTVSLLLHLLLVVFFGGTVLFNKYVEPRDFESPGILLPVGPASPPTPVEPVSIPSPAPPILPQTPPTGPIIIPFNSKQPGPMFPIPQRQEKLPGNFDDRPVASPVSPRGTQLPGQIIGRVEDKRKEILIRYKAGKTEPVVAKALQWLSGAQNPDGTWGSSYKGAMTGLALLVFLGHDETQQSPYYGKTVAAGIDALLKAGETSEGRLSYSGKSFPGGGSVYQHAIATYALSEAYAMTNDKRITPVLQKAVAYIVEGQRSDGGWAYGYDLDAGSENGIPKSDTSVSGWQAQALKAAELTKLPFEKASNTRHNAMNNFERVFDPKSNTFGYRKAGDRTNGDLTGVGVLCLAIGPDGKHERYIRDGLKTIIYGPGVNYKSPDANLYRWYYDTQACFMTQKHKKWETWDKMFKEEIMKNQSPDGSWPPTGGVSADGKATEVGGLGIAPSIDGKVYRTALCALMLEVYYRYPPASK